MTATDGKALSYCDAASLVADGVVIQYVSLSCKDCADQVLAAAAYADGAGLGHVLVFTDGTSKSKLDPFKKFQSDFAPSSDIAFDYQELV